MRGRWSAVAIALSILVPWTVADAQAGARGARPRPEARVDYLGRNPDVLHVGLGLNVPVGTYLRVEIVGAGGPSWRSGRVGGSGRADALARFSFDPFRERRWGLSAGGGLSVRYDELFPSADRLRLLVAIVADLEGPARGSVAPALQLGLGGGTRVGIVLRSADRFRR